MAAGRPVSLAGAAGRVRAAGGGVVPKFAGEKFQFIKGLE